MGMGIQSLLSLEASQHGNADSTFAIILSVFHDFTLYFVQFSLEQRLLSISSRHLKHVLSSTFSLQLVDEPAPSALGRAYFIIMHAHSWHTNINSERISKHYHT